VFFSATALISSELYRRLDIGVARLPPLALLPVMFVFAAVTLMKSSHPFAEAGWVAWPIAFAVFYRLCRRQESEKAGVALGFHVASALLLVALVSWEFAWQVSQGFDGRGSWTAIAWALIPAAVLWALPRLCARFTWPFGAHRETYAAIVGSVLAMYLAVWSLGTNFSLAGDPYPLPYLPLLNFLDLAEVFVLLVLVHHGRHLYLERYPSLAGVDAHAMVWAMAALVFVWLNAVLLRTIHHWAGVPFELEAMFRSTLVQSSLTIFWALLALATTFFANRKSLRIVWYAAMTLLALSAVKLFVIDLARVNAVGRIVSAMGVGVLMLVIGYVSPRPPAERKVV